MNSDNAEKMNSEPVIRLEVKVHNGLMDDIRLGNYKLGQRLPSESELAKEYGCSRPVIRSALAKLRESGLIVSRQGAGSFVSRGHPAASSGFTPLDSINDIASYFRFRKLIEAETVQHAAEHIGSVEINRLKILLARMDEQIKNGDSTVESDFEFHQNLAKLSDNRFLFESLNMLQPHWLFIGRFVRSLQSTSYRIGKEAMSNEHKNIVDALEDGNGVAARKAMVEHIEGSERRVFKGDQ